MPHCLFHSNSTAAREKLDWDTLVSIMLYEAHFDVTRRDIPGQFLDVAQAEQTHDLIDLFIAHYDSLSTLRHDCFKFMASTDENIARINYLQKFSIPNADDINFACHIIIAYKSLSATISAQSLCGTDIPQESLKKLLSIVTETRTFIDPDGSISYDRHPELRKIQIEIDQVNRQLRSAIQGLSRDKLYEDVLANDQYDIRADRYVISIMADRYKSDFGQIIDRSQSGMTLYVEPLELRVLSNKRLQTLAKRDEILNSLFLTIGKNLSLNFQALSSVLHYILKFDLIYTKTSFSRRSGFTRPIFSESNHIKIINFFHPLLTDPIKNSVDLPETLDGILISGPNTGGKTVALKSIILCHLFSRMGLYVPAQSAQIPIIEHLYYLSHDNQNLSQGLSSFSSEAIEYIDLIDQDTIYSSHIFIDEIFNSTSSEEASALAIGLIEHFSEYHGTKLFISSHHHRLKTYIHEKSNFLSSHVGFDLDLRRPTYNLLHGSPGASMAITVFSELSKGNNRFSKIVTCANKHLDNDHLDYEKLLEELQSDKSKLDQLLRHNKQLNSELKSQKKSSDGVLFLERQKILDRFKDDLNQKLKKANQQLQEILDDQHLSEKQARRKIDQIKTASLPRGEAAVSSELEGKQPIESPRTGDVYFCSLTKSNVEVLTIKKSQAQVLNKSFRIWVPIDSFFTPNQVSPAKKHHSTVTIARKPHGSIDFNARGMRLEAFQAQFYKHLEDLYCGDIPYLNVIHGHGDGVLKSWLRSYLKSENLQWKTPDGNDGITIIYL